MCVFALVLWEADHSLQFYTGNIANPQCVCESAGK